MKVSGKLINKALEFVSKFNQNVTIEHDENSELSIHAEGGYGYGRAIIPISGFTNGKIIINDEIRKAIPNIDEEISIYVTEDGKIQIEANTVTHTFNKINSLFDCSLRYGFTGDEVVTNGIEKILYAKENDIWFYNGKIISGGGYRLATYDTHQKFESFTCSSKLFDVFPNPQKIVHNDDKIMFYRVEENIDYMAIFPDIKMDIPQAIQAIADDNGTVNGSATVRNNKQELLTLKLYDTTRADVLSNGYFAISIDSEIGYGSIQLPIIKYDGIIDISVNLKYLMDILTKQGDEINVAMENIIGVDVLTINEEKIKHIIVPLYRK